MSTFIKKDVAYDYMATLCDEAEFFGDVFCDTLEEAEKVVAKWENLDPSFTGVACERFSSHYNPPDFLPNERNAEIDRLYRAKRAIGLEVR